MQRQLAARYFFQEMPSRHLEFHVSVQYNLGVFLAYGSSDRLQKLIHYFRPVVKMNFESYMATEINASSAFKARKKLAQVFLRRRSS